MGVYQLISRNCALKGHQKRFGFTETTACLRGHAVESAEHFLFECPRFCQERLSTLAVALNSMASLVTLPPLFSSFPLHVPLVNARVSLAKTKRLNFSLAGQ